MTVIRKIEIKNFRSIKELTWMPNEGMNCLIGPGDSGKSTVLDAIDLCLGARKTARFSDADFHDLDVNDAIKISVTLGQLDAELQNFEIYGLYLRGFDSANDKFEDEPGADLETTLTVLLSVQSDLDPIWSLVSSRADTSNQRRNLTWNDRVRLSPIRIGISTEFNMSWARGSVLNKLSEEKNETDIALTKAMRHARQVFSEDTIGQLGETTDTVASTANELGVVVGKKVRAMLDSHSASFNAGTISLHDESGVPLSRLGMGSIRLLISGLQRKTVQKKNIILMDEVEYGLEPHRICRLLNSLGAKDAVPTSQSFVTTHSPIVLRELRGDSVVILRGNSKSHIAKPLGTENSLQGTIRLFPEAFLAKAVIVCEGASEVGLIRGIDIFRTEAGKSSFMASGVSLVDAHGIDNVYPRAITFRKHDFNVVAFRDDDVLFDKTKEKSFLGLGGKVFKWRDGYSLEKEIFECLPEKAVTALLNKATELHGRDMVDDNIKSASCNSFSLASIELLGVTADVRTVLAAASSFKKSAWFKSVSAMEDISHEIIAPNLEESKSGLRDTVNEIFLWIESQK